jgi:hypothetical protein
MKLQDLINQNGGKRPLEHWECPAFLGGCNEVAERSGFCPKCGKEFMHVKTFTDKNIKL